MFRLIVVQARYGDCFVLEFGSPSQPHYVLVDGGPGDTYERHLRGELRRIRESGGKLDLAIVSHVDQDHILGMLDLMAEVREQRANDQAETVPVAGLWHNAFGQTVDSDDRIQPRLEAMVRAAGVSSPLLTATDMAVEGIAEGHQLRMAAAALGIPVNAEFDGGPISTATAQEPLNLDNLRLQVVGPTEANLQALASEWLAWLENQEASVASGDPHLAEMADRSVPNLSSISILAEADEARVLLTGDGRGDHLLEGLAESNLLDTETGLHLDVLKVPHHGSARNVTRDFFKTVTADRYVISADGRHGNPDLATLIWIVEAARNQDRRIEIVATNETPSISKLRTEYPPSDWNYRLTVMDETRNALKLELTP